MLHTFDQTLWKEDPIQEIERQKITAGIVQAPKILRELFPFNALVLDKCIVYGLKKGDVLDYVRVKHVVNHFPIEVLLKDRYIHLSSSEVQLFEV